MLQGKTRGKVGDIVFRVNKGQQIASVYNPKPANPKTTGQMRQRVKLGSAVTFYRDNKAFFPFAFSNKKATETEYNAFVRENINIAPYIGKYNQVDGAVCLAPYKMTIGELNSLEFGFVTSSENNIYTSIIANGTSFETYGDIRKSLGLSIGDMITIYVSYSSVDPESHEIEGLNINRSTRLLFSNEVETKSVQDFTPFVTSNNDIAPQIVVEEDGAAIINMIENDEVSLLISEGRLTAACCVVVSRNVVGEKLKVSNSVLSLNALATEVYNKYRTESALESAAVTYGWSGSALLDPNSVKGFSV
ncbi:MAG: hypothetical protein HUJ63_13395, partial [Enterococcus sp.]|nr:hypothetical protein [Enterococcus sp.]